MENYEVVLEHHGVTGMKWGVRRYQNKDGSLTSLGKRRAGIDGNSKGGTIKRLNEKRKEISKNRAAAKKQKAEDEARKEAEAIEAKKEKILKSRSAKELYKNAHLFTDSELQKAYNRLNMERNIANLSGPEVNKGAKFVENTIKTGRQINELVSTGTKLYNNVAKIYNIFSKADKKIPTVDFGGGKEQQSKKTYWTEWSEHESSSGKSYLDRLLGD